MKHLLIALAFLSLSTVSVYAIPQPMVSVPTLSEWGLIALIVVIGIAGALMLRKRIASARPGK